MNRLSILAASVALALGGPGAFAADPATESLIQELEALKKSSDKQRQDLRDMESKLKRLEDQLRAMGLGSKQIGTLAQAAPPPQPPSGTAADPKKEGGGEEVVKEPARSRSVDGLLLQRDAVFDQKFTIEPAITYSRFDRQIFNLSGFLALDAIFLGTIDLQQTKADLLTLDLTGRWGVTPRLQLDANIPYLYRDSTFISGGAGGAANQLSEASVNQGDIGDVSVGAYYQLTKEEGNWPDLIANVRVKAPTGKEPYGIKVINPDPTNNNLGVPTDLATGSGVWSAGLGLSFLKTSDPAIFFGNIGWIHHFEESFDDISSQVGVVQPGEVDLRDAFLWGLGIGFAVNERTSLSLAFNQLYQQAARQRVAGGQWIKIVGSDASPATFNVGLTYALSDRMTLLTNLGVGLTDDSPDFAVRFSFPYSW